MKSVVPMRVKPGRAERVPLSPLSANTARLTHRSEGG